MTSTVEAMSDTPMTADERETLRILVEAVERSIRSKRAAEGSPALKAQMDLETLRAQRAALRARCAVRSETRAELRRTVRHGLALARGERIPPVA